MSLSDKKSAERRMPLPGRDIKSSSSEGRQQQQPMGQSQSGMGILLNWCIMIVGFGAVALLAYWLLG